jgi:hypothetical protein
MFTHVGLPQSVIDQMFPSLDALIDIHRIFLRSFIHCQSLRPDRSIEEIGCLLVQQVSFCSFLTGVYVFQFVCQSLYQFRSIDERSSFHSARLIDCSCRLRVFQCQSVSLHMHKSEQVKAVDANRLLWKKITINSDDSRTVIY